VQKLTHVPLAIAILLVHRLDRCRLNAVWLIYLFLAFPVESIQQQLDAFSVLRVDGKMEGVASHVVNAVDVDATSQARLRLALIGRLQYLT